MQFHRLNSLIVATACAGLLVAACSGADDDSARAAPTSADAGDSEPIRVDDDFGPVELPGRPERIVTLVDYAADLLASFDVTPAAAQVGTSGTRPEYLGPQYADLPSVGAYAEPSLEAIAAEEPDLIIGLTSGHGELREQLTGIAPTIIFEPRTYTDVLDHIGMIGSVLGEEELAEEISVRLEADLAALHDVDAGGHTCLAGLSNGDGTVSILPANTVAASVLDEYCTYAFPEDHPQNSVESSVEALIDLDPDYFFVAPIVQGGASALPGLQADPLWPQFRAASEGNVTEVEPTVWLYGRGPNAIAAIIEESRSVLASDAS